MEQQGTVAFSPRTTSLTVTRPRGQKPADERFFEKLENEARVSPLCRQGTYSLLYNSVALILHIMMTHMPG